MFPIKKFKRLTPNIFLMDIYAPRVADKCLPGQFVICRIDERGERIPLTICDYNRDEGIITIVVQEIGASTLRLGRLGEGDYIADFVGPLGNPSDFTASDIEYLKHKNIIFIAGGVGTAPVYPQVKWLYEHGIYADVIIGARNNSLIILSEEIKCVAKNVYIITDDGSSGEKGLVTDKLKRLVENGNKYDLCIAIGPIVMMKFVSITTKELGIKTIVSMNPIMVDGTGMCGACRLSVDGQIKFACVDGPEFDGHLVNFDEAIKRQNIYKTEEGRAFLMEKEGDTHHGGCGNCSGE